MQQYNSHIQPAPAAQVCGVLISIWQSIQLPDLVNAGACAATGTIISFLLTSALRHLFKALKSKRK
jgi:hypothetical protein